MGSVLYTVNELQYVRFVLPPILLLCVGGGLQGLLLGGGGELVPDRLQLGLGSYGFVLELLQ